MLLVGIDFKRSALSPFSNTADGWKFGKEQVFKAVKVGVGIRFSGSMDQRCGKVPK
jgi:hypothetical protein